MIFRLQKSYTNNSLAKLKVLSAARVSIITFPMGTAERLLNSYCLQKYKLTLKNMCLKLIANSTASIIDDTVKVTFIDKKLDNIASLITYGTGRLPGSNILKCAFLRDYKETK